LPPGWISQYDQQSQRTFYIEQSTGRSQWEPPALSPPPPSGPHGASPQPNYGAQQGYFGAAGIAPSQASHTAPNPATVPGGVPYGGERGHDQPGGASSSFYNGSYGGTPASSGVPTPGHDANAANYAGGAVAAHGEPPKPAKEDKKSGKSGLLLTGAAGLAAGGLLASALGRMIHCVNFR
jgi:hypothetical protein